MSDDRPTTEETATELVKALDENPFITARGLTTALQENTNALSRVRNRYRIMIMLTVALVMVISAAFTTRHDSDVNACRKRNALRSQVDVKFGVLAHLVEIRVPGSEQDVIALRLVLTGENCGAISWW